MHYKITPVPKPRMTKSDQWKNRKKVLVYYAFKDECRLNGVTVPEDGADITFIMPMPKSWSEREKRRKDGQPHKRVPDIDNLLKGLLDAVYDDDSRVSSLCGLRKLWGREGGIVIK